MKTAVPLSSENCHFFSQYTIFLMNQPPVLLIHKALTLSLTPAVY